MRRCFLYLAALSLAVVMLMGCSDDAPKLAQRIDVERLITTTNYQCREIGTRTAGSPEARVTARVICEELEAFGFSKAEGTLECVPFIEEHGLLSENIIATVNPGAHDKILCVAAHYDCAAGTMGARDNAASVAGALEVARILTPVCKQIGAEVRILFFGAGENGCNGSRVYCEQLTKAEIMRHRAVFNLDVSAASHDSGAVLTCMTLGGLNHKGQYVAGTAANPADNLASRAVLDAYCALTDTKRSEYGKAFLSPFHEGMSDHASFDALGVDAVTIGWRIPKGGAAGLPKEVHRITDIPDTIDYKTIATSVQCILSAMEAIGRGTYDVQPNVRTAY
ncbi:MAG: M28 family peptidase [Pygmaiobacter sp.]